MRNRSGIYPKQSSENILRIRRRHEKIDDKDLYNESISYNDS